MVVSFTLFNINCARIGGVRGWGGVCRAMFVDFLLDFGLCEFPTVTKGYYNVFYF